MTMSTSLIYRVWAQLIWLTLSLLSYNLIVAESSAGEDVEEWKQSWRLPEDVKPHEYNLRLEPRLEDSVFIGQVTIFFTTDKPRNTLILHSKNLNITNVTLYSTGLAELAKIDPTRRSTRQQVDIGEWFPYEKHEFLVVKLKEMVEPGQEYALESNYQGSLLTGRLNGFYKSRYTSSGKQKTMATTKFEPNHARLAFPCFDEPAMKAAFNIEVIKPSQNETVVSNMPQLKEEIYDKNRGSYLVRFEKTPVMSTYSLCWILSDFHVVEETVTSSGVQVRGLARRGHEGSLHYATDITKKSVEFFEQYLGVDYGLPKLDIIGVPDFSSGAMENWGMVTFKETNVMINANSSGYMDYFSVVNVVCHEIAHMWFGNLVTMKWWDDIWLNEGFATFLSMKCTKALQPQLDALEIGYIKKKLSALSADSVVNTHAIVNPVTHNDQLSGVFDEIAYRKGHSLLEMFEDAMGNETFRLGLNTYLKKFEQGVAETSDLRGALDIVPDFNMSQLIDDWTTQPGYPLVTVEEKGQRLLLTQTRYIDKESQNKKQSSLLRWNIPVKYTTADEPQVQQIYFSNHNHTAEIELKNSSSWYKLNAGGVGFYRVNYPEERWNQFHQLLSSSDQVMSSWSDRASLLDDACSLASSGYIKYGVALNLFSYLSNGKESDYAPWRVASKCLNDVKKRLPSTGLTNTMFSEYVRNLIEPVLPQTLASINRKKSSSFDFDLSSEVIFSLGCAFKHPDAVGEARRLFELWLNDSSTLNLDIKGVVFRYGASGEDEESRWERLWSLYQERDDPHELRDLRIALVSFKSSSLLKRLVEVSKNESLVRSQDYYAILSSMATKKKTNNIVWQLFKSEYDHLEEKFSGGKISKLFQNVASNFYTRTKLKEVKDFVQDHPGVVPQKADQMRVEENIVNNMKWREKHEKEIELWLMSRNLQTTQAS